MPPLGKLAQELKHGVSGALPTIEAPPGVLYNVVGQPGHHRLIVHLLNYKLTPVDDIRIQLKGEYRSATLLSPDLQREMPVTIKQQSDGSTQAIIPTLKIYDLLVLDR